MTSDTPKIRGAILGRITIGNHPGKYLTPTSLLATVFAPLWGGHGAMGRLHWPCPLWVPWEPTQGTLVGSHPFGWPKAHGPLGGKYTLERRRWGSSVYIPPLFP